MTKLVFLKCISEHLAPWLNYSVADLAPRIKTNSFWWCSMISLVILLPQLLPRSSSHSVSSRGEMLQALLGLPFLVHFHVFQCVLSHRTSHPAETVSPFPSSGWRTPSSLYISCRMYHTVLSLPSDVCPSSHQPGSAIRTGTKRVWVALLT